MWVRGWIRQVGRPQMSGAEYEESGAAERKLVVLAGLLEDLFFFLLILYS